MTRLEEADLVILAAAAVAAPRFDRAGVVVVDMDRGAGAGKGISDGNCVTCSSVAGAAAGDGEREAELAMNRP